MSSSRNLLPSLCFALALTGGSFNFANAQQAGGADPGMVTTGSERLAFDAADTNYDGLVSEAELARDAAVGFSSLDKDRSGTLTPSELGPHDPAKFSRIDANGDGVLTFPEVMRNKTRAFAAGDKNGDGGLSFEEMVEAATADDGAV
jgi:EF hand